MYFALISIIIFWIHIQALKRSPQADCEVAKIPENEARNRFTNIFPCKGYILCMFFFCCFVVLFCY